MEYRSAGLYQQSQQKLAQGIAIAIFLFGVFLPGGAVAQTQKVDLELVLATDSSTSIDDAEFDLQQRGLALAFLHPDVIRAIGVAGNRGVAISLVQWSGSGFQVKVVDWFVVRDRASAAAFSARIAASGRQVRGMTSTAGAIRFSANEIAVNGFEGQRKVIDVSGDGSSNPVLSLAQSERAVAQGISINGLVIFNKEYDLGELADINIARYYSRYVIGGPGAFLMAAKDYKDFQIAIRKKLVREISGATVAVLP